MGSAPPDVDVTLYDITPRITPRLGVWPGDTAPSREVLLDIAQGDPVTLSTLHATVHLGAHADAPSHYGVGAASIESRDLTFYLGRCQVMHLEAKRDQCLGIGDLVGSVYATRLLIGTGTFPDPEQYNTDFAALSPELVEYLNDEGVRLVGIDTPSVDLFESKELPSHQAFLRHDMAILEGLVLREVPAGCYELIALPLPLEGFDASPVRAVLRTLDV